MAAVAARSAAVRRTVAPGRQEVTRSANCVRRRPVSGRRRFLKGAGAFFGLALLFGYVNVYANLAATSSNLVEMNKAYRAQRIQNERLKLSMTRASVAPNIAERAEAAGMEYASRYDYLSASQTVARADKE